MNVTPRLALVFVPMAAEALRASANERTQRARGGVEPAGDVYDAMRMAYPAIFLAMIGEGAWRGTVDPVWTIVGVAMFGAAKVLKWWAIVSLGGCWTFRVLVVPGMRLVAAGPYRWLRHPNYVAVVLEIIGAACFCGAAVSGPLAIVLFGALLWRRIAVEDRALAQAVRPASGDL